MIQDNWSRLRSQIKEACKRSSRDIQEIQLVLVTKQVALDLIEEAYQLGVRDFGENRVQEWLDKKDQLPDDIRWHLIGHLQTNKVRYCIGKPVLIHSLDSLKLASEIEKEAQKKNTQVDCLIQVNTSGEATKHGVSPEGLERLVFEMQNLAYVRIQGLMTMGPLSEDQALVRSAFRKLKYLRDEMKKEFPALDWKYLSMGMSSDFQLAIEEGANLLRIGTAVFGERVKQ